MPERNIDPIENVPFHSPSTVSLLEWFRQFKQTQLKWHAVKQRKDYYHPHIGREEEKINGGAIRQLVDPGH